MSSEAGQRPSNPYNQSVFKLLVGSAPYERLKVMGDMGALALRSIRQAVTPPFPWIRDAAVQFSFAVRRCSIPLVLSHSVYLIGFGIILFGGVLTNLGLTERVSGFMHIIWSREIGTWITAMIFAGVVGSAITADLGARKIREELDALSVLGVEHTRTLVVPRVVATTLAQPILAVLSLFLVDFVNFIISPSYYGFSNGVYFDGLKQIIDPHDLFLPTLLKNVFIGFFVGVVACYKGLTSPSGAEGVGRAVNQTVVTTFFGIWMFNVVFNLAYFTLFPDVATLRG